MNQDDLVHRSEEKMVDARKEFYENADVNERWEKRGQFTGNLTDYIARQKLLTFSQVSDPTVYTDVLTDLLELWTLSLLPGLSWGHTKKYHSTMITL